MKLFKAIIHTFSQWVCITFFSNSDVFQSISEMFKPSDLSQLKLSGYVLAEQIGRGPFACVFKVYTTSSSFRSIAPIWMRHQLMADTYCGTLGFKILQVTINFQFPINFSYVVFWVRFFCQGQKAKINNFPEFFFNFLKNIYFWIVFYRLWKRHCSAFKEKSDAITKIKGHTFYTRGYPSSI